MSAPRARLRMTDRGAWLTVALIAAAFVACMWVGIAS